MFKRIQIATLTGLLALFAIDAEAQQDPQLSMYFGPKLFYNPASAGMNDGICLYMLGRQQWTGFEGRPETYLFGAHGTFVVPGINLRSGGGLSIMGDGLGQMHFFGLKAAYSAHIPLNFIGGEPGHLGVGLSLGMLQFAIGNNWRSVDPYYSDPIIPQDGYQLSKFDMDFGLYYKTEKLYFGISSTHLNGAEYSGEGLGLTDDVENNPNVKTWNSTFAVTQHFYVVGGYNYALPNNPMFVLKPSILLKTEAVSSQVDLNMLVEWDNLVWGGLTYRFIDAVVVMGGVNYPLPVGTLRGGYAYDITTSKLSGGSNGSHEIFLQYCFKLKQKSPVQKHKSVRFL